MSDKNPWKINRKAIRYDNPWIKIEHNEVTHPSGNDGIYGVVRFKNIAVGVVTLDENNQTCLVGQFRFPLDRYSWEIPEGGCPQAEDPLDCAKRELQEETGFSAQRWTKLGEMALSNSVTDEVGVVYLAQTLTLGESSPEESEELSLKHVPFREALDMVLDGRITDSLSIIGILLTDRFIKENA